MRPRVSVLVGALLLVAVGGPALGSPGPATPEVEVAVTLQDPAIDESSGAVVRGDWLFTVNDSGDGPHVYEVDLRSGRTAGVTTFADEDPVDVEALAGTGRTLWVGDIGDNRRSRSSVAVYRLVPVPGGGRVPATRFDLEYPDRPHDAETLLVHPRTGRVYVVTKSFRDGGTVFRGPRRLEAGVSNRLERVGSVPGLVTDGTFLPEGDRVLLRTYGGAALYSYPGFEQVLSFPLPPQQQGEAIAVGDDGRVYLTSEGARSDVLVMDLPTTGEPPVAPPEPTEPSTRYDPQPWMGLGPAGLLLAVLGSGLVLGLGALLVRAARRRGRRRR